MQAGTQDWLEVPARDGRTIRVRKSPHPRARHLRLTVTAQGARLSCPHNTHPAKLFAFLKKHGPWLEGKLAELCLDGTRAPELEVGVANQIMLTGEDLVLAWEASSRSGIERLADRLVLRLPEPWGESSLGRARTLLRDYLETCVRQDVSRWLPGYVDQLGRAPTGIRMRVLKSLWGSLDSRDRISLDLSLALAPREALRYVLVHELAHLAVRDHSRRFWAQVEALMPDYKPQRNWLRQHGGVLKIEIDRLLG